ncbi:MAG: MMPL family transporter [Gammaproteobacteria bacterium]
MEGTFYRLGKVIYHLRWLIIIAWLVLLFISAMLITKLHNPLKDTGFKDPYSESAQTNLYINGKLGYSENRYIILYNSKSSIMSDAQFKKEMSRSLNNLKHFPIKNQIIYPDKNNKQISADKHSAYATILFEKELNDDHLKSLRNEIIIPRNLSVRMGGEHIFLEDTKQQTQTDLYKAEYIATPVALITLLIVFGSVVAASLPILLGGLFTLIILTTIYTLGHFISLSIFTINIALLLGLCINVDYSLFFISRFRYKIEQRHSILEAIAISQATAGKAIFFSGLVVMISLSALLFFPINVMFSVGIGGIAAVAIAVLMATLLLPAILAVLGHKINSFTILSSKFNTQRYWHWFIEKVVRHPWKFFIPLIVILLVLLFPFSKVKFGISDFKILPTSLESRHVFDVFRKEYGENKLTPIIVMIKTKKGNILSQKNLNSVYDIAKIIKRDPRVTEISSIVNTKPPLAKDEYYPMYNLHEKLRPTQVNNVLKMTTTHSFTIMSVVSKYDGNSPQTKELIKKIRRIDPGKSLTLQITGDPVNTFDILNNISKIFFYAILSIIFFTYIILLILFRSLILPLKAIILTIISLFASYGVLVFIFQQGHFAKILNFEPQNILDITLLIIIFCSLFGFSMDYEVFLLTRIKEEYEKTNDNIKSITSGIEHSSKIITSAATIVIVICLSFMFADILIVKAFGLGVAIAIFVDAFLIRTILVPASMLILGSWNWYLPKWLDAILPKISFNMEK